MRMLYREKDANFSGKKKHKDVNYMHEGHQEYAPLLKGLKKKAKETENDKEIRNLIIK